MKLLIITQKVDEQDPVLSFFHNWIKEFSSHFERTSVICLEKGKSSLPEEIKVFSLGKERLRSRVQYLINLVRYVLALHREYDSVFVHMNQEYLLLMGLWWKITGKKVYLWRNHHAGSLLTDIAARFCRKVFCTSKFSYTANYQNTVLMPVGVDLETFRPSAVQRKEQSALFLARIAPSKKPDLFIKAIKEISLKLPNVSASIYGDPLPHNVSYYENLKSLVLESRLSQQVQFHKGIPNKETVSVYSSHKVFVNLSSSGMYDKTIFEAMACGCLVLASNKNLVGQIHDQFIFEEGNLDELVTKLTHLLNLEGAEYQLAIKELSSFAQKHTLKSLGAKLKEELILQG